MKDFSAFQDWLGARGSSGARSPWIAARPGAVFEAVPEAPVGRLWMATSGTTSADPRPRRWIAHSRGTILCSAETVARRFSLTKRDHWACILPVFHMGGLMIGARAYVSGARAEIWPGSWDPAAVADWLELQGATVVSAVPAQVWDWVKSGRRAPPAIRAVVVGADRLPDGLASDARALGWPVLASYGMTETASMIACEELDRPGALLLLEHATATAGEDDEFAIRCGSLFEGELSVDGEARREYIAREAAEWIAPDRARVIEEPRGGQIIEVIGRRSDSVKVLGELVDLADLDRRFARLLSAGGPGCEAAFVATPDQRMGCRIELVWAGPPGVDDRSVAERVERWNSGCGGIERIVRAHRVASLPRTELGKLKRAACLALVYGK